VAIILVLALVASATAAGAQPKVWRVAALSPVGSDVPVQDEVVQ